MMNNSETPLDFEQIKKKISTSLNNKLARRNVQSIDDISKIDLSSFAKEVGVGKTLVQELRELQDWLLVNKNMFIVNLSNKESIINFDVNPSVEKIEFKYIPEFFPGKLLNNLIKNNINTVGDLKSQTYESLLATPGIAKHSIDTLSNFASNLKADPDKFLEIYNAEKNGTKIPSNPDFNEPFLKLFKDTIDDYIKITSKNDPRRGESFMKYFGLMGSSSSSFSDIGLFYDITFQRVRMLVDISISELKSILRGNLSKKLKVRCDEKIVSMIDSFLSDLKSQKVFSKTVLISTLKEDYNSSFEKKYSPYLDLLFKIFDIRQGGSVQSSHSDTELFFADKKIDKDVFFQDSKNVFDALEESVLPISFHDLIIKVRRANRAIKKNNIELVLKVFPEIEVIALDSQEMYQIRLDKLSSSADMVERILDQIGESTHVDKIVREIQVNLQRLGSNKKVTKISLSKQLKDKKHIVSQGRTGIYSFLKWEENTDSISRLIRKALLHYNHPLSHKEIIKYIKNIRSTLKETSIRTITAMEYIRLNDNKFILPEWKRDYKNDVAPKLKKMPIQPSTSKKDIALIEIKNYINTSGPFGCQLIELAKKMAGKLNYNKQTIYKIISENKNEFVKFSKGNKTWIRLSSVQNVTTNVYNWQEIQKELSHDLLDRFNTVYQTIPNSANFQDVLNMLKALIDATTAESGLDGLNEQLLPTGVIQIVARQFEKGLS